MVAGRRLEIGLRCRQKFGMGREKSSCTFKDKIIDEVSPPAIVMNSTLAKLPPVFKI